MSNSEEQTIVISDLLSFMTCKIRMLTKENLLSCLKEFYSEDEAEEALKTFLSSLPPKIHKYYRTRCKGKDSFTLLYSFLKHLPKEHLPVFVCKDLNNIPKPDSYDNSDNYQEEPSDLINEQKFIKSQISEISSVVYQLKDQIHLLTQKNASSNKVKENGLAYLQKLIDEEDKKKCETTFVKKEMEDDFELSEIGEDYSEFTEDEPTLHLKANRMQRALVKNAETMNLKRARVNSSKRSASQSFISKVKRESKVGEEENQEEDDDDADYDDDQNLEEEEEIDTLLREKGIQIQSNDLDMESSLDNSIEMSTDFNESEAEKSHPKIYLERGDSSCLEDASDLALESGTPIDQFPFIVVEQVFDESVGHFSIYKCSLCNFSTNDVSAVKQHDCPQIHSEDPSDGKDAPSAKSFRYFCLHCRFKCNGKSLFKKHTSVHPQTFPCPFCNEKFLESETWTEHVMLCVNSENRNPANHVCQVCRIIYANSGALLVHKGFHDPAKPFECMKCRYRFYTQETLDRHFKSHLINGFKCPFCDFVNKNKTTLATHIRCHTGEMPFACRYCDYRSSSQSALTSHSFCHTDKKPIKCDECPAYFKTLHKLNSHKITHLENRLHKCPVCEKGFKTGWLMTIHHQRIHLNLRPHACSHCDYKARSASALKSHLSTHSNEKLFKCFECEFRANHKGYLKRHINIWHSKTKED